MTELTIINPATAQVTATVPADWPAWAPRRSHGAARTRGPRRARRQAGEGNGATVAFRGSCRAISGQCGVPRIDIEE
jgi:hypothetical protein